MAFLYFSILKKQTAEGILYNIAMTKPSAFSNSSIDEAKQKKPFVYSVEFSLPPFLTPPPSALRGGRVLRGQRWQKKYADVT